MRFSSLYGPLDLFVAVREVLLRACPLSPDEMTTQAFDPAKKGAGHPRCPRAKVICVPLGRPWQEVKRLALDEKADLPAIVAAATVRVRADRAADACRCDRRAPQPSRSACTQRHFLSLGTRSSARG